MMGELNALQNIDLGPEFNGFEVFVVGGAVRDAVRGDKPDDIDLMVVARPGEVDDSVARLTEQMPKRVNPETSFPVFMDSQHREVALPRTEESTGAGFQDFDMSLVPAGTPIEQAVEIDLERRDLTMNAMAFNIRNGELFDPFNGLDAIQDGLVQHVSDAFSEDPLRVVRMARFAGRFDATVDSDTRSLARDIAPSIGVLPRERLVRELRKVFKQSERPDRFFTELVEADALEHAFPVLAGMPDEQFKRMKHAVFQVHHQVGRDVHALFGAMGAAMGERRVDEFTRSNPLTNRESEALDDGATFVGRVGFAPNLSPSDLLTVANRLDGEHGLNVENAVAVANVLDTATDGFTFRVDTERVHNELNAALTALHEIDGQHVMNNENIDPSDIGTDISGREFSELLQRHRAELVRQERP